MNDEFYGYGWATYKSSEPIPEMLPDIDNEQDCTDWLEGFTAAHAEYPDYDNSYDEILKMLVNNTELSQYLLKIKI